MERVRTGINKVESAVLKFKGEGKKMKISCQYQDVIK